MFPVSPPSPGRGSSFVLGLLLAWAGPAGPLRAQDQAVVSLKDMVNAEVRQQGFSLPRPMKVHVFARGGGLSWSQARWSEGPLFAYGWILNAATREVVWQMGGANMRRDGKYQVSDQYIDLPKGEYEAYFANHGHQGSVPFFRWSINIDRRRLNQVEPPAREDRSFVRRLFGGDTRGQLRNWREQAANYGMEIYLPKAAAAEVRTFQAPLQWRNILVAMTRSGDHSHQVQAFKVRRSVTLHVYALGEGHSEEGMYDYGWIQDLRTRKRVWQMEYSRSQFAGGAQKNRRSVDKVTLPPGEYIAHYVTDGSHSPADWNAAPPCDPGLYGITLSVPVDAEFQAVSLSQQAESGAVLAELVRVRDDQDLTATFTLQAAQKVRVYAFGEIHGEELADFGWIEDAKTGKRVWSMEKEHLHHAGGAYKNRLAEDILLLPKGTYTLRYRTDDSHAFGRWNADPPRDPERYGITVFALE